MTDDDVASASQQWISRFEAHCSSDDLSIGEIIHMTEVISYDNLLNSSFLHRVCMNEKVTLEIVEYLLELYPPAVHTKKDLPDIVSSYSLHLACYNKECPNEVIQLLLRKGSYQLQDMCYTKFDWGNTNIHDEWDTFGGLPLHFYLSRTSNVDLNIVKKLVVNAEMLLSSDKEGLKCTPIHILLHNESIGEMYDVVKYLVETNPSSLQAKDVYDKCPLHVACGKRHMKTSVIEFLLRVCPDSIYHPSMSCDWLPIHCLCEARMDDEVAIDVLKLLLEAHPDSVSTETSDAEELPLHIAATNKSPAFCRILLDAYPESLIRRSGYDGSLPFHCAFYDGRPDTLEYLFKLFPESLYTRNNNGYLPIHCAGHSTGQTNGAEIIKFLLIHDPECLSRPIVSDDRGGRLQGNGALPLHVACSPEAIKEQPCQLRYMTRLLFDLYPEAILIKNERGQLPVDVVRSRENELSISTRDDEENEEIERLNELVEFFDTQMRYACLAQDGTAMRTPEPNGLLPLHNAIRDGAPLGSIKLLVKGNPIAINVSDGIGMLPLDIASQSSTLGVVKYLAELSSDRLNACDVNKNFPLHHACRGGNCEVIVYLLETPLTSAAVSEKNVDGMLPIHLFCDFVRFQGAAEGRDNPKYTETIWRLLTAYPETVLNW